MKRLVVLAFVCLAVSLTSCHRPQEFYKTEVEYHFANNDDAVSVKAILGSMSNFWQGDYAYKGLSTEMSDIKAVSRFRNSIFAAMIKDSNLKPYFNEGDYIIYRLVRTTNGDMLLVESKLYFKSDGDLNFDDLYYFDGIGRPEDVN